MRVCVCVCVCVSYIVVFFCWVNVDVDLLKCVSCGAALNCKVDYLDAKAGGCGVSDVFFFFKKKKRKKKTTYLEDIFHLLTQ